MDIQDEIDRSFGSGPEPRPVDALVADGRRALRRRRATTGAAALAIVLVAGGTTWAAAGPGTQARGADPSVTSDASPRPREQQPATYDGDGTLVLRDGVTVLRQVDNPMNLEPPKKSVGLVLDDHGKNIWMLLESDPGGGFSILGDAHEAETTFDRWLREAVAENQQGSFTAPAEEEPAAYTGDGRLVLQDGVTVLRQVDNPMDLEPPKKSVGLVLDDHGKNIWMLLESDPGGGFSARVDAGETHPTFDLWLADQVAVQQGRPMLALVAFGDAETLVPDEDGVEVLEQRASPQMPADFASTRDRTAVAEVRWKGSLWFVLARQLPGSPPQYFPTESSVAHGATTIDGFLEYARAQYSSGDGLR